MPGTLYLCATPIGNLEDITFRVLRTLREADLIAAEDTRHSIKLLNHFDIKTPMTSYHEYNKVEKAAYLVERLKEGLNIALITDAGTPGISDPGEELVRQCAAAGISVTSLPGPAACITALSMSGLPTRRFCFEAFLPSERSDKRERQRILEELKKEFEPKGIPVFGISAVSGKGVEELLHYLFEVLKTVDRTPKVFEKEFEIVYAGDRNLPYTVEQAEDGVFVVEGPRIEKMLGYTNLDSEKGFDFFQKFLKQTGILADLEKAGIKEGDTVRMYGLEFDYYK